MKIEECKKAIDEYKESLKAKSGKVVEFNESGPVGMKLIDALFAVVESQAKELGDLKQLLRENFPELKSPFGGLKSPRGF